MKDNKQQVVLTCLLRMAWPKDAIDNDTTDLQCAMLLILKKNPEFIPFPF